MNYNDYQNSGSWKPLMHLRLIRTPSFPWEQSVNRLQQSFIYCGTGWASEPPRIEWADVPIVEE